MREISCQVRVVADERVSAEVIAGTIRAWAESVPGVRSARVTVGEPRPQYTYCYSVQSWTGAGWASDPDVTDWEVSTDGPEAVARKWLDVYFEMLRDDAGDQAAVPAGPVRVLVWEGEWEGEEAGPAGEAACILRWAPPG